MLVIVDYGVGNLASVSNMLKKIGVREVSVSGDHNVVSKAKKILLPGVGAFDGGMKNLQASGLIPILNEKALKEKVPVLGICLGMQMLGNKSEEGELPGLGWIDAETIRFRSKPGEDIRIPHMGWEYVSVKKENPLLSKSERSRFYFVHSYHVRCKKSENELATCHYGSDFTCMVNEENIFGAQFHPEKSLRFGMEFLENFSRL
jgi:glutamine amidotransferase